MKGEGRTVNWSDGLPHTKSIKALARLGVMLLMITLSGISSTSHALRCLVYYEEREAFVTIMRCERESRSGTDARRLRR